MKNSLFFNLVYLMIVTMLSAGFISCSKDDNAEDASDAEALQKTYVETKANIIGTWIMEAQYYSSYSNLNRKIGWDSNDEYGFFKLNSCYKFNFYSDGTFINKDNEKYNYTIELDEKRNAYYTSERNSEYWPFKKGTIVLKFDENFYKKTYIKEYFIEIKSDKMLYFYDTSLGKSGEAVYKFRKQ